MVTYLDLALDLEKSLHQNTDDKEINRYALFFWIFTYAKALKRQRFEKDISMGNKFDDGFLNIFNKIPVYSSPTPTNQTPLQGLKYIIMPESVMSLSNNKGINYIAYSGYDPDCSGTEFTMATFTRTQPNEARRLYMRTSETEKPSPKNVYYFRTGDEIYFVGIEQVNVSFLEAGIYSDGNFADIKSVNEKINLPSDMIGALRNQLLGMGRFILMLPADVANDGTSAISGRNMQNMGIRPTQPAPVQNGGSEEAT